MQNILDYLNFSNANGNDSFAIPIGMKYEKPYKLANYKSLNSDSSPILDEILTNYI